MKVEVGAGTRTAEGFLAVDLNPRHADVIADALALPFADGTVEELRAVDVAEHVSYRDSHRLFAEWARVCKPGALIYVQVPAADVIFVWAVNDDEHLHRWEEGRSCDALWGAQWRLLGSHADGKYIEDGDDWRWGAHYSLWSKATLAQALELAGFTVGSATVNGHPNVRMWATRKC